MTLEQMAVLIKVFQLGFSCSMANRFDIIYRYCEAYPVQLVPYKGSVKLHKFTIKSPATAQISE